MTEKLKANADRAMALFEQTSPHQLAVELVAMQDRHDQLQSKHKAAMEMLRDLRPSIVIEVANGEAGEDTVERIDALLAGQVPEPAAMCAGFKIAFETLTKKTEDALVWRNTGSPNGLRRFMTKKQYDAQTPGVQKWYEPIRYDVPEGWQLVPVESTEEILRAMRSCVLVESCYRAMLDTAMAGKLPERKS